MVLNRSVGNVSSAKGFFPRVILIGVMPGMGTLAKHIATQTSPQPDFTLYGLPQPFQQVEATRRM
jgi:hypothetical protein